MTQQPNSPRPRPNKYPPWAPRFWNGMRISDYFSLLKRNRFSIHPTRYPMTAIVAGCSVVNSAMAAIQGLTLGRKIAATKIEQPPIFVIGHWRSGTTLMHELLSLDEKLAYPSNLETFVPHHFLVSSWFASPLINLLMPRKRPMDNMTMDGRSPQEDDFALCSYGAPTPYRRIAFPNRHSQMRDHMALNLNAAPPKVQLELRKTMEQFLKTLTVRFKKQLVLKSPPHTGRIAQLAEWFPGAKFVHLARNPYDLVPSTIRLWKLLDYLQAFQVAKYDDSAMKSYVFECQDLMYTAYFEARDQIPKDQLIEIRFEDLVQSPVEQMKSVYDQLGLDGFVETQPRIEQYFAARSDHKRNEHTLDEAMRQDIDSHWRLYRKEFGYE